MRNIDLDSLQVFQAVVDYGGIKKAAVQLNRVPSNVTTRVKNLEDRLGVKLFQRQSGKLVPSSEGLILLGYAERLLRLSSEAEAVLRSGTPRGTLRIGTSESTAAARLPPLLSRYHENYPDVQIELATGTSSSLIARVHRCELEAAFVSAPVHATELTAQEAFVEELVLIAPRNAAHIESVKQLLQVSVITFPKGCSYRRILEDWLATIAVVPDRVLELASYHAIVACVAAGSGVAIMPRSVLHAVHATGQVKVLPLPPVFATSRTHLIWRSDYHSVALHALRKELEPSAEQ